MGVDATIVIRKVPADIVTDEWLTEMSWRICDSIGAEVFWLEDGLFPREYAEAKKRWEEAFDTHPLTAEYKATRPTSWFARTPEEKEQEAKNSALHKQIMDDIGPVPKERRLAFDVGDVYDDEDCTSGFGYGRYDDEPNTSGKNGPRELSLSVSTFGRYYGPGYERGNILNYCAIAEWFEQNIPGCEVFYGGDGSVQPFPAEERERMRAHLYTTDGRAYYKDKDRFMSPEDKAFPRPPACGLCPGGNYCGARHGWGPNFGSFHCSGCGKGHVTNDGGATFEVKKDC